MAIQELSLDQLAACKGFWEPESDTDADLCTHRLRKEGEQRVVFRSTVAHLGLIGFWMVSIAAAALLFPLVKLGVVVVPSSKAPPWGGTLLASLLAAYLAYLCFFKLRSALAPIVFDKRSGTFWRGKAPEGDSAPARGGVRLAEIVAIQLLAEVVYRKGRRTCYELNLVLANGKRVQVIDHSNQRALEADVEVLSKFLGVPVLAGQAKYED